MITVFTAQGKIVSQPTISLAGGRVIAAPLAPLARGAYTVRWHATSADSHTVSGVFTFGVRAEAPVPTEAYGASGPTRTEHVVRWAYFVALALLIGGLGMRLLVLRGLPLPRALEQRLALLTGIGVVAVLEVGIAAFLLRADDALQLPFGDLLYGDLSPISGGTRFGHAFVAMTLGYALVSALLFLAWLLDRTELLWGAFVVSLGFASGLSLSGHSAVDRGSSWLSQLADWVHLSAACLWLGGLLTLVVCVWPLAPELRRAAFLRFSRLATVLVGLLVVAGVYLSLLRLPQLSDLWTASYGRVLLVKLVARVGGAPLGRVPPLRRAAGDRTARLPTRADVAQPARRERRRAWRSCSRRRCSSTRSPRRRRVLTECRRSMSVDERVRELGLEIPEIPAMPFKPALVGVHVHGGLAYLSGMGPVGVSGVIGGSMTVEEGYLAARQTGLLLLRRIVDAFGTLDAVDRWVKVLCFVRSAPGFGDQPSVANGFSELIVQLWGEERGLCARSAIGVSELPTGIPVEVEATVALR